jgi:hypothetical protein
VGNDDLDLFHVGIIAGDGRRRHRDLRAEVREADQLSLCRIAPATMPRYSAVVMSPT